MKQNETKRHHERLYRHGALEAHHRQNAVLPVAASDHAAVSTASRPCTVDAARRSDSNRRATDAQPSQSACRCQVQGLKIGIFLNWGKAEPRQGGAKPREGSLWSRWGNVFSLSRLVHRDANATKDRGTSVLL